MLLVQQQYVLNTHSTVSAYVLAVASSYTCFAAAAAKTKYIILITILKSSKSSKRVMIEIWEHKL